MTRPRITKEKALVYLKEPMLEEVFLIGIRGYYQDTMGEPGKNDRGIYDDCICLIAPNLYLTFNANTDPSINRSGIASLVPGRHYFKKGLHGITRPGGGYPAFRPATTDESLPVNRDGKTGTFKGIAINIHKGGNNATSSEGCQTIYPDQWLEFQKTAYRQMDLFGQRVIPYELVQF